MSYPQTIRLAFEDGDGEATKSAQGEAWHVLHPSGDWRFYGTKSQVLAEIKREYPEVEELPTQNTSKGNK